MEYAVKWIDGNGYHCICCRLETRRVEIYESKQRALRRAAEIVADEQLQRDCQLIGVFSGKTSVNLDTPEFEDMVRCAIALAASGE